MKLIHTTTLEIKEFIGIRIPPYAILSHTWEDEEVSYQDITLHREYAEGHKGLPKIYQACRLAREEHIEYT